MLTPSTDTIEPSPAAGRALRVIAVASGKGGVGKTNLVANLALALRRRGLAVVALDADLGLANLDTLLGLVPRRTLREVLRGDCGLEEILVEGPEGIQIVPAASGFEELTRLPPEERTLLLAQVGRLEGVCDVLLLDTAAGITPHVLFFAAAAHERIVVVTPEPTSLTDAYALVKVLAGRYAEERFGVVVNLARDEVEARRTFAHFSRVTERFLHVSLEWLGWIPRDEEVVEAVRRQQAVLMLAPGAPASRAVVELADRILSRPMAEGTGGGVKFFFERLVAGQAA